MDPVGQPQAVATVFGRDLAGMGGNSTGPVYQGVWSRFADVRCLGQPPYQAGVYWCRTQFQLGVPTLEAHRRTDYHRIVSQMRNLMKKCETSGCTNLGYEIYCPEPDTAVWLCVRCIQVKERAKSA